MAQPKEPPLSIRLGGARLALIDAYAAEHGLKRHAAVLKLIDTGLTLPPEPKAVALEVRPVPPRPTAWPSGAALLPEHTADPGPAATTMVRAAPERPVPFKTRLKGEWSPAGGKAR